MTADWKAQPCMGRVLRDDGFQVLVWLWESPVHAGFFHVVTITRSDEVEWLRRPVRADVVPTIVESMIDAPFASLAFSAAEPMDPGTWPDRQKGLRLPANVYFVRGAIENSPIKIGKSLSIYDRLDALQLMSPVRLELIAYVDCIAKDIDGHALERELHREFASIALVPILLALAYAALLAGYAGAQDSPAATGRGARESGHGGSAASSPAGAALDHSGGAPIAEAHRLTAVLARALTVWERPSDGHVVYAHHCRTAPGGCEARLRAIALELLRAGRAHGVDPWLLAAMAYRESGLNPDAIGAVGEVGVLQLHPRSARGRRALAACARAPSRCTAAVIWLAAEGLAASLARCGSEPAALGAYNRGHCGVTSYSRRVLRQRELLLAWAGEAGSAEVTAAEGEGPSSAAGRGPEGQSTGGDPS